MSFERATCLALALVACLLAYRLLARRPAPSSEPRYRGLTARQWERELADWPIADLKEHDGVTHAYWWEPQSPLRRLQLKIGVCVGVHDPSWPLFKGDPAAAPVLCELLKSNDRTVRWAAAKSILAVRRPIPEAVPAIEQMLADAEDEGDLAAASAGKYALRAVKPEAPSMAAVPSRRPGRAVEDAR